MGLLAPLLAGLCGLAGCGLVGSPGSPGSPDRCLGLGESACRTARSCQAIYESCTCRTPPCNADDCPDDRGCFLGCAPVESQCQARVDCRPAGQILGPDVHGCRRCSYATSCETAWQQLLDGLATRLGCRVHPVLVSGFRCRDNPVCITRCINQVEYCTDIGCGLCSECVCAAVGRFEQCYFRCLE